MSQFQNATILWFDVSSGEGVVELLDTKEYLYLHYTCIEGIDKNRYAFPIESDRVILRDRLRSGTKCSVSIYENLYSRRVEYLTNY